MFTWQTLCWLEVAFSPFLCSWQAQLFQNKEKDILYCKNFKAWVMDILLLKARNKTRFVVFSDLFKKGTGPLKTTPANSLSSVYNLIIETHFHTAPKRGLRNNFVGPRASIIMLVVLWNLDDSSSLLRYRLLSFDFKLSTKTFRGCATCREILTNLWYKKTVVRSYTKWHSENYLFKSLGIITNVTTSFNFLFLIQINQSLSL